MKDNTTILGQKAYQFILQIKHFVNISEIERLCDISRSSLMTAIHRKQKLFRHGELLIPFLNDHFPFWHLGEHEKQKIENYDLKKDLL